MSGLYKIQTVVFALLRIKDVATDSRQPTPQTRQPGSVLRLWRSTPQGSRNQCPAYDQTFFATKLNILPEYAGVSKHIRSMQSDPTTAGQHTVI